MSNYTERLTITVPASLADIAEKIGRAMDPDTGGERSFSRTVTGYNGEDPIYGDTLVCSTPCVPEFKAQAQLMLADPAMLHYAVSADYAARWPDHEPPTLAECEQFIAALTLE